MGEAAPQPMTAQDRHKRAFNGRSRRGGELLSLPEEGMEIKVGAAIGSIAHQEVQRRRSCASLSESGFKLSGDERREVRAGASLVV